MVAFVSSKPQEFDEVPRLLQEKPSFEYSGKLAAETNKVKGEHSLPHLITMGIYLLWVSRAGLKLHESGLNAFGRNISSMSDFALRTSSPSFTTISAVPCPLPDL